MTLYRLAVLLCLLGVMGCESTQLMGLLDRNTHEPPDWCLTAPDDTSALYACGEGQTLEAAEESGRQALAAQVRVDIESAEELYQITDDKYQNEYYRRSTKAIVGRLSLFNAEIIKRQKVGNDFYCLVSIRKSVLAEQQLVELQEDLAALRHALTQPAAASFDRWWALKQLQPLVARLRGNAMVVSVMGGQPQEEAKHLALNYEARLRESERQRALLVSNKTNIADVEKLINKQLYQHQIKLLANGWSAQPTLLLVTQFNKQRIGNETHIDGILSVTLLSSSKSVLAEHRMEESVVVLGDVNLGKQMINRKLYAKLARGNVIDLLIGQGRQEND